MEQITPAPVPHNAKAVIALTSWKKRISTVGLTIFNLLTMCGHDYHIVLTLSEDEFPRKESELPTDLVMMNRTGLFEILWIKRNVKSFKKCLYTMQKYRTVPIITADDDCVYCYNYAEELYQKYKVLNCIIANSISFGSGYGILFTPFCFPNFSKHLSDEIIATNHDDYFYKFLIQENKGRYITLHPREVCRQLIKFHDDVSSITEMSNPYEKKNQSLFEAEFGFSLNKV